MSRRSKGLEFKVEGGKARTWFGAELAVNSFGGDAVEGLFNTEFAEGTEKNYDSKFRCIASV